MMAQSAMRPCDGDEMVVDDEVAVDTADGVKNSLDLHQFFPDVSSPSSHSTATRGRNGIRAAQVSSISSYSKPAALGSDSANSDVVLPSNAWTEKRPNLPVVRSPFLRTGETEA